MGGGDGRGNIGGAEKNTRKIILKMGNVNRWRCVGEK
jgi:hypothetical protein